MAFASSRSPPPPPSSAGEAAQILPTTSNLLLRRRISHSAPLRIDSFHTASCRPASSPNDPFHTTAARTGAAAATPDPFHSKSARLGGAAAPDPTSSARIGGAPPEITLYDVLGVAETASPTEIKRAFRQLARRFHPDTAAANGNKEASAARFVEIRAAYATLSDPEMRTRYDKERRRRFAATAAPPYYGGSPAAAAAAAPFSYCSPRTPYSTRGRSWETDQCWC